MISTSDYAYESLRRVRYGDMQFVPVCLFCGRFVKADEKYCYFKNGIDEVKHCDNATCSRCGRVQMPFEGYFGEGE